MSEPPRPARRILGLGAALREKALLLGDDPFDLPAGASHGLAACAGG
jgi:hypothetical protein